MSSTTKVNVDFIAEYKGAGNIKRAQTDMEKLTGSLKTLGKAFAVTFAAHELIAFGKESVKAFANNEKQVALLNNTLKNLGKSYAAITANAFIDHLALASGKTKEELIPAFQGLLIATNDVTTAQSELQLALDISAGTGKDLSAVQAALSKAYLGNTTALTRLGAGLSKTILATKDMKLINAELARVFGGDLATAMDTTQGKFARLSVAATEAKVIIGEGLVKALYNLTGSTNIDELQKKIVDFGTNASNALQKFGAAIHDNMALLKDLGVTIALVWTTGKIIAGIEIIKTAVVGLTAAYKILRDTEIGAAIAEAAVLNPLGAIAWGATLVATILAAVKGLDTLTNHLNDTKTAVKDLSNYQMSTGKQLNVAEINASVDRLYAAKQQAAIAKANADAKKKADAAALKAALDLKKAAADKLALERASLALKLGGQTVDMQNIEIQAALQRGQTEQVTNVLLLQRAIINGNADQVIILSQQVLKANGLVMDVNGNISALADAKDPFKDWPPATKAAMDQLKAIQDALALITDKAITISVKYVTDNPPGVPKIEVPKVEVKEPPVIVVPVIPLSGNSMPPAGTDTGTFGFSLPDYLQLGNGSISTATNSGGALDPALIPNPTMPSGNAGNGPDARYDQANPPVTINITAPPSTVIDTTQAASTNGTRVSVNRLDPLSGL